MALGGALALTYGITHLTADTPPDTAPIATGLPERSAPPSKVWNPSFSLQDGVLLNNGRPFFPIGFVFGSDDKGLSEAAAMGCTAVHFAITWSACPAPGPVDKAALHDLSGQIELANKWGLAAFPLLIGHYIPDWFSQQYPLTGNQPLDNHGQPIGSWTPYSLHFPAMRAAIQDYWKASAELASPHANVVAMNLWNEPAYGGRWDQGGQFADYSTWGVADWVKDLKTKYSTVADFNAAFGTSFTDWSDVQPPKSPEEHGRKLWLEWTEYGQRYFAGFFDWEKSVIRSVAPKLLLTNKKQTNPFDSSAGSSGTNWRLMDNAEDISGLDLYSGSPFSSRTILDAACSYAGKKPVMVFEINTMPPTIGARTPDTIRTQLWAPLVGGARGMFIFALIKESEHGLLNDANATPEARAEYTRLIKNISGHQRELASPRLAGKIGVVYSTIGALQYDKATVPEAVGGAFDLFRNSHYQVDFIPEEDISEAKLADYQLVVLPSACVLTGKEKDCVGSYTEKGGHVLCFAGALSTDEYLAPMPLPKWLGISNVSSAIGDRSDQRISKTDPRLSPYLDDEIQISGVEQVSPMAEPTKDLILGSEIKTNDPGEVLAYNSDSYPTVISTNKHRVVYCAFRSEYSEPLRGLMEGITREIFGLKQEVRLANALDKTTDSSLLTGLRTDYTDTSRRYLLVINSQFRKRVVKFDCEGSWKIQNELLHPKSSSSGFATWTFEPREVYLFTLKRQ